MLKRSFFTLLATTLLSFYSFSQTPINSAADFLAIANNLSGNYIQTADIVLGDLEERANAIINATFSGTYDGDGYSISFSATFTGDNGGLFKEVSGEIKDLNINNSYATLSGTANNATIGLICGTLKENGVIKNCHVIGDINSNVTLSGDKISNTGLIAGKCNKGIIHSCSAIGNVSGVGCTGGITGLLDKGTIRGCSFVGSVRAIKPETIGNNNEKGAYAGGIAGFTKGDNNAKAKIYLSYANAEITGEQGARGMTNTNTAANAQVENCFAKGIVNGDAINTEVEIANANNVSYLADNATTQSTLNTAIANDDAENDNKDNIKFCYDNDFYFSREADEMVLVYGKIGTCNPPSFTTSFTGEYGDWGVKFNFGIKFNEPGKYEWELRKLSTYYTDGRIRDQGIIDVTNTDTDTIKTNIATNSNPYSDGLIRLRVRRVCDNGYTNYTYKTFYLDSQGVLDEDNEGKNDIYEGGEPGREAVVSLTMGNTTPHTAVINVTLPTNSQGFRYKVNGGTFSTIATTQGSATISLNNLNPNTIYRVDVENHCLDGNYSIEKTIEFSLTEEPPYETVKDGAFNDPTVWNTNSIPSGNDRDITIKHNVILPHTLILDNNIKFNIFDGDSTGTETAKLIIDQQGQLINKTSNDILGIVEVKPSINEQKKWEFIGAPFKTVDNINKYKLESIVPVRGSDVVVSLYNDEGQNWNTTNYANYQTIVNTGSGYFGYPFYTGAVTFTTYGDLWDWTLNNGAGGMGKYTEGVSAKYKLNKGDVTVSGKTASFVPLSNPYPAKLSVAKFLDNNQVQSVYKYNHSTQGFELVTENNTEIDIAEGFFVKLKTGASSVTFSQSQLTAYPTPASKSQSMDREFVELVLTADNISSKLYFAHNEQAELGYDMFDADKLFAMVEMTEPYFLTQGIRLVKEEVNALPYYATMNVRSYENKEVSFKANNIPQGIAVSLIDGEETIELNEGVVYTTNVSSGENANRFKVLFSQSVGLNDVEELEVNITNDNRLVNITTSEEDLQIEVYNALGQRVFATKDLNFSLNNVSAGAYMIKAFNNKASKTQKIIIK